MFNDFKIVFMGTAILNTVMYESSLNIQNGGAFD